MEQKKSTNSQDIFKHITLSKVFEDVKSRMEFHCVILECHYNAVPVLAEDNSGIKIEIISNYTDTNYHNKVLEKLKTLQLSATVNKYHKEELLEASIDIKPLENTIAARQNGSLMQKYVIPASALLLGLILGYSAKTLTNP